MLFNSQLFFENIKMYVNKTGCRRTIHTEQNNKELMLILKQSFKSFIETI